jgi:hypothetical protein
MCDSGLFLALGGAREFRRRDRNLRNVVQFRVAGLSLAAKGGDRGLPSARKAFRRRLGAKVFDPKIPLDRARSRPSRDRTLRLPLLPNYFCNQTHIRDLAFTRLPSEKEKHTAKNLPAT